MIFNSKEQSLLLDTIFSNPVCGIILINPHIPLFPLLHINSAFEVITEYSSAELANKPLDYLHSKKSDRFLKKVALAFENKKSISSNVLYKKKDCSKIWVQVNLTPVLDTDDSLKYYLGIVLDITKSIKNKEKMYDLAYYDQLTKVGNRHLLMSHLRECTKQGDTFALLFIDLDKFKAVNDTFGHAIGDRLLKMVATRISRSVRKQDFVARLGGDEFIVVVKNSEEKSEHGLIAQRIVDTLQKPFVISDHHITISSSVGIALFPDDAMSIEVLFKNADKALYEAKRAGGNTVYS